jgi:predicted component of type VI protein secretion system
VSTATLELRASLALDGHIEDAIWDLPKLRLRREPIRALVAGAHEWPLAEKGRWVLGRSSDCDIHLDRDDSISRRHAEIALRAGQCLIRDLGSCNGTLLNGNPVERARLRRGDVLLIGETEIRVR